MTWTALAVAGGVVYAAGGFAMGAMNAEWFGLERNANSVFPLLGLGVLAVVIGWAPRVGRRVWQSGFVGRAAVAAVMLGGVFFLLNPVLQFAIFGTLLFGFGLGLFTVALWRGQLLSTLDCLLAAIATVASLTWNTETLSAFLLVAVGLLLVALSLRMHTAGAAPGDAAADRQI